MIFVEIYRVLALFAVWFINYSLIPKHKADDKLNH